MADKRVKQKYRSLSCDPALSVHDNVNHHQNNKRDQHVNTFTLIGSQLVVMVLRAHRPLGAIAQFFHFAVEENKKTRPCEQGNWNTWMVLDSWDLV